MVPGPKTLIRLLITLIVLGGFYVVPKLIKPDEFSPYKTNLGKVNYMEITGFEDGDVTLNRTKKGWKSQNKKDGVLDKSVLSNLLCILDRAKYKPSRKSFQKQPISLKLSDSDLRKDTVELGQRLKPFQLQLIRINGKTFEATGDLNACLGIWDGVPLRKSLVLSDNLIYDLGKDDIKSIEYISPFSTYSFVSKGTGDAKTWNLTGPNNKYQLDREGMKEYCKDLSWLASSGVPGKTKGKTSLPYTVNITPGNGKKISFNISEPVTDKQQAIVELISPEMKEFLVSQMTFSRVVPRYLSMIKGLETAEFNPDKAVKILAERNGHRFIMQKNGGKWEIIKPKVSFPIAMAPPEPGSKPSSLADFYVKGICNIRSNEIYNPNRPESIKLLKKTFRGSNVKLKVKLSDGRQINYKLSKPFPGTSKCVLKVDKQHLIVSDRMAERLVPDVNTFFSKEDLKGKKIKW